VLTLFDLYNGAGEPVRIVLGEKTLSAPMGQTRSFLPDYPELVIASERCRYEYQTELSDYPWLPGQRHLPMQLDSEFTLYVFPPRTQLPVADADLADRATAALHPTTTCN
jgi:hypothetical protein